MSKGRPALTHGHRMEHQRAAECGEVASQMALDNSAFSWRRERVSSKTAEPAGNTAVVELALQPLSAGNTTLVKDEGHLWRDCGCLGGKKRSAFGVHK